MIFRERSNLDGEHALFSPSQSSWLRYDDEQMLRRFRNRYRTPLGTEIHEYAASQIALNIKQTGLKPMTNAIVTYIYCKYLQRENGLDFAYTLIDNLKNLPDDVFETTRAYINDSVALRMKPEQKLYYSDLFFGTTDAICMRNGILRIHDLKTGDTPAHMEQLMVYAALYFLQFELDPVRVKTELRLYQSGRVLCHEPETEEIEAIISKIVRSDELLTGEMEAIF